MKHSRPVLKRSRPVLNCSRPVLKHSRPVLNFSRPVRKARQPLITCGNPSGSISSAHGCQDPRHKANQAEQDRLKEKELKDQQDLAIVKLFLENPNACTAADSEKAKKWLGDRLHASVVAQATQQARVEAQQARDEAQQAREDLRKEFDDFKAAFDDLWDSIRVNIFGCRDPRHKANQAESQPRNPER